MEKEHPSRIRFHCDRCGRILRSPEAHAGRPGKCVCGNSVIVPFAYENPSPENPLRGVCIAGCRIDCVMGRGSTATVYKGHHLVLDIPVAIKILECPQGKRDEKAVRMFLEEAKIIAKLHHPNVIDVINAGEEDAHTFIVTRYVMGTSLGTMIRRKEELPIKRLFRIFLDVCNALQSAHRRSILHGDVKPDHILLTPPWRAILIDFGLAGNLRDYEDELQNRRAMGTPLYMSPERAKGEHAYDFRSDIYSLGATMYHALAGQPPFDGPSIVDVLRKHAEEPLVPLVRVSPRVPLELSDIVSRAMDKDPDDRFQTVGELKDELKALCVMQFEASAGQAGGSTRT
jgi:eukaryotic-like serine/threonine-protein kinase